MRVRTVFLQAFSYEIEELNAAQCEYYGCRMFENISPRKATCVNGSNEQKEGWEELESEELHNLQSLHSSNTFPLWS